MRPIGHRVDTLQTCSAESRDRRRASFTNVRRSSSAPVSSSTTTATSPAISSRRTPAPRARRPRASPDEGRRGAARAACERRCEPDERGADQARRRRRTGAAGRSCRRRPAAECQAAPGERARCASQCPSTTPASVPHRATAPRLRSGTANQPQRAGAERHAHRHLLPPRRRAREEEIRHIRAANQQHAADRADQREQRRLRRRPYRTRRAARRARVQPRLLCGLFRLPVAPRSRRARAGRRPESTPRAMRADVWYVAEAALLRASSIQRRQARPRVGALGKREPGGITPMISRGCRPSSMTVPADDVGGAAEGALPQAVADHELPECAGAAVLARLNERPRTGLDRQHAGQRRRGRRDPHDLEPVARSSTASRRRSSRRRGSRASGSRAPVDERAARHAAVVRPSVGLNSESLHEPIRLRDTAAASTGRHRRRRTPPCSRRCRAPARGSR